MSLREMIAAADEDYLVTLANRGLYKRALRELPEAGATPVWEGDALSVKFADGTQVEIAETPSGYRCSCPSRSVCKHILMAILAAQQDASGKTDASCDRSSELPEVTPKETAASGWEHLLTIPPETLQKLAGKRNYNSAAQAVMLGEEAEISEGSTLSVTLPEGGQVVRFLPGAPPESAGCSCKSPDFCLHRVQAVLLYRKYREGNLPEEFLPRQESGEDGISAEVEILPYLRSFVAEVVATGLVRLPEGTAGRFLQLATICHGQRLARMERICHRVAGQLDALSARSALFSRERLTDDLTELLLLAEQMEAQGATRETAGVFRETYHPLPALDLLGLGAYGWQSTGGYTGVTCLFYAPEPGQIYRYTTTLPTESTTLERLYASGAPWGIPARLGALSHTALTLRRGKATVGRQLSATDEATAQLHDATDPRDSRLEPIRFGDFSQLLSALWRAEKERGETETFAIVEAARTGAGNYDPVQQRWSIQLFDCAERSVTLTVDYQKAHRLLLEQMMDLQDGEELTRPLLVRASLRQGGITAFPITLYGGAQAVNLGLDQPRQEKRRRRTFDWGDL